MTLTAIVIRGVSAAASLLLFYLAWFVYENEERRLQSKIEEWWIQFDSLRKDMVGRQDAFARVVAIQSERFLQGMFGAVGFTRRAFVVALCVAMASFSLTLALAAAAVSPAYPNPRFDLSAFAIFTVVFIALLTAAVAPAISERYARVPKITVIWTFCVIMISLMVGCMLTKKIGYEAVPPLSVFVAPFLLFIGFSLGALIVMLLISIMRNFLADVSAGRIKIVRSAIAGIALGTPCLCLLYVGCNWERIRQSLQISPDDTLFGLLAMILQGLVLANSVVAVVILISALMLVHRGAWPLLSRALYNFPRHEILAQKKALNTLGVSLAVVAIYGHYGWRLVAKYIGF